MAGFGFNFGSEDFVVFDEFLLFIFENSSFILFISESYEGVADSFIFASRARNEACFSLDLSDVVLNVKGSGVSGQIT